MNDEQRQRWKETHLFPLELWSQGENSTPLLCPLPTNQELKSLAEAVPEHIQCSGWYLGKPAFGEVHVYGDNFSGMGRQALFQFPSAKRYFSGLGEYIAAVHPRTILRLLRRIDDLERRLSEGLEHLIPRAVADMLAERRRQVQNKGWTPEHDDGHVNDEIAAMAAFYAMPEGVREWPARETGYGATWGEAILHSGWRAKVGDRRRELVKAAALLLAEIERMDRLPESAA